MTKLRGAIALTVQRASSAVPTRPLAVGVSGCRPLSLSDAQCNMALSPAPPGPGGTGCRAQATLQVSNTRADQPGYW
jgi:hypothetical protein